MTYAAMMQGSEYERAKQLAADYSEWSPAQLAYALGWRINIKSAGMGNRTTHLVSPCGKSHPSSYDQAHKAFSRLARMKRIDVARPPTNTPRALINGREQ